MILSSQNGLLQLYLPHLREEGARSMRVYRRLRLLQIAGQAGLPPTHSPAEYPSLYIGKRKPGAAVRTRRSGRQTERPLRRVYP